MATEFVVWVANRMGKDLGKEEKGNLLNNLKYAQDAVTQVINSAAESFGTAYASETLKTALIQIPDFGEHVVAELIEMFKEELSQIPNTPQ